MRLYKIKQINILLSLVYYLLLSILISSLYSCKKNQEVRFYEDKREFGMNQIDKEKNDSVLKDKVDNINWIGTYEYEDESHTIILIIRSNNEVYFQGEDTFGPTHKFECTYELNDNTIEIYFKKAIFDKINIKKLIKYPESPLYILSYNKDILYTQTQFDSYGLENKNIYFKKRK